jgi:hypothetical protein
VGERRGDYRVLARKNEGKRPLGKPTRRWEINTKQIFEKRDGGAWTGSTWFRIGTGDGLLCLR